MWLSLPLVLSTSSVELLAMLKEKRSRVRDSEHEEILKSIDETKET